jgi:uncharacterized protein DUF6328
MKLDKTLHVALDELRMQMLGTQVLFGFQLQGAFLERAALSSEGARIIAYVALLSIVLTLGLLLAPPCQHRLVERGFPTIRLLRVVSRFASVALLPFTIALSCDFFVVLEPYVGDSGAAGGAAAAALAALSLWYVIPIGLRRLVPFSKREGKPLPTDTSIELHERIDQMLTEARVVLPGAQALLGFQFAVTMTNAFSNLPEFDRAVHFVSLCSMALAIGLLLTPATIHRLTFGGRDDERFHMIGSGLVTAALAPILVGVSTDFYVAATAMLHNRTISIIGAAVVAAVLAILWFAVPVLLGRHRPAASG